ncbi:MAG: glycosyltransferase family 2 protein [Actinomycetota bacterium]
MLNGEDRLSAVLGEFVDAGRRFTRPVALLGASSFAAVALAFFFIDPSDFAGLFVLASAAVALAAPAAMTGATEPAGGGGRPAGVRGAAVVAAAVGAATGLGVAAVCGARLGLGSGPLLALPIAVFGAGVAASIAGSVTGGTSPKDPAPVAWAGLRAVTGVGAAAVGADGPGVLLAVAAADAVAVGALLARVAASGHRHTRGRPGVLDLPVDVPAAVAAAVAVALIANVDVLVAAIRLSPARLRSYCELAVWSKAAAWTAAAWFVPRRGPDGRHGTLGALGTLRRALGGTIAWTGLASVAGAIAAVAVVSWVRGEPAGDSLGLASVLLWAPVFAGALLLLIGIHVAFDTRASWLLAVVGVLQAAALAMVGASPIAVAWIAATAAAVGAVLLYHAAAAICRWTPPLSRLRPHEEVPRDRASARDAAVELSVVVPCHNSGPSLHAFLDRLEHALSGLASHEIVVVSDGSTDDTVRIAHEFSSDSLRVFHYPERSGKGHALRVGLNRARGAYVAFIDADGDIAPEGIQAFLSLMRLYRPDIVLGSKRHPLSTVAYPPLRRAMSWAYHKMTRLLFRVNVRDTQTGLKLIRRDVLQAVLPRMLEKRFAFDLELLVVARMLGFTRVFEAPVQIDYQFTSHVDVHATVRIVLDTVAIFYRRFVLNSYRHRELRPVPTGEGAPVEIPSSS